MAGVGLGWQLKPLAQSESAVQVWARPLPGTMRAMAVTASPSENRADTMAISFACQFDAPGGRKPACSVPRVGTGSGHGIIQVLCGGADVGVRFLRETRADNAVDSGDGDALPN